MAHREALQGQHQHWRAAPHRQLLGSWLHAFARAALEACILTQGLALGEGLKTILCTRAGQIRRYHLHIGAARDLVSLCVQTAEIYTDSNIT